MNVKITYTVPFEEIPKHVRKLMVDSADKLAHIDDLLRCPTVTKLHSIDEIRKKLASLDFLLRDCYSILAGYEQRVSGEAETQDVPNEEEQHDETTDAGRSS